MLDVVGVSTVLEEVEGAALLRGMLRHAVPNDSLTSQVVRDDAMTDGIVRWLEVFVGELSHAHLGPFNNNLILVPTVRQPVWILVLVHTCQRILHHWLLN